MKIEFELTERLAGFVVSVDRSSNTVELMSRELVAPTEPFLLANRLEKFQGVLFSKIPGLPPPCLIENLTIIITPDLHATAYINELKMVMQIQTSRSVRAGEPVYVKDIEDIKSVNTDVEIPKECGLVMVRSFEWRRSIFYDLTPLDPEKGPRDYEISSALAEQELLLLGVTPKGVPIGLASETPLGKMLSGYQNLKQLLNDKVDLESCYQELLTEHHWMLGGYYSEIRRHTKLDDVKIPDFTAVRCYDRCNDIIEIKQPFLRLFKDDGNFASSFNDSWNQAEKYLTFARNQRQYLREEKQLIFENPRCLLVLGFSLKDVELKRIREKETLSNSISVYTYDNLIDMANHIINLTTTAADRKLQQPIV